MSSTSAPPINHASSSPPQVKFECPVCLDVFQLPEANEQIRVLGKCSHNLCHTCLVKQIGSQNQRKKMECPICRTVYPLYHPNGNPNPEALAGTFLTHKEYLISVHRNELVTPFSPQPKADSKPVNRCTSSDCSLEATHNCLECGLQCATHELLSHQQLSPEAEVDHTRINLEEKRKEKEQKAFEQRMKEIEARKQRLDGLGLEDLIRKYEKVSSTYSDENADIVERKKYEEDCAAICDADLKFFEELEERIRGWKLEVAKKKQARLAPSLKLWQDRANLLKLVQTKIGDLRSLPSESVAMDQWSDVIVQARLLSTYDFPRWAIADLEKAFKSNPLVPIDHHPMVTFLRKQKQPSILSESLHVVKTLRQFLAQSHRTLVNSRLIYKASWHGWTKEDFEHQCAGKSNTLVLVKVTGNGYLFGAYVAPEISQQEGGVPDLTKKSFLFSLINKANYPFRLSLADGPAIDLSYKIVALGCFDYKRLMSGDEPRLKWCNLCLFGDSGSGIANGTASLCSSVQDHSNSYQLDEESKNAAPQGFNLDNTTFGGSPDFVANEIEVYQLSSAPIPSTSSSSTSSSSSISNQ